MNDYSNLLAILQIELKRVGENLSSDRVSDWCRRAAYNSFHDLDQQGLEALLNAVKQIKTNEQRRTQG